MEKDMIVKVCRETATCTSCHAANYDSKFETTDRKRVKKLYEVHVGGITFMMCDDCVKNLISELRQCLLVEPTAEDITIVPPLGPLQLKELTAFDRECLMSMEDFIEAVTSGCILDDDGTGDLVLDDKMVANADVCCDIENVFIHRGVDNCTAYTFEELYEMFGNRVQIAWYNK